MVVQVRAGAPGSYLTDGSGRSLYMFASDSATKSSCTGACLTYWPPLRSSAAPMAGSGAVAGKLTTISGAGGAPQVSYAGHPLYYFAGDRAAGDTTGQGSTNFGAKWWLLAPSGQPITTGTQTRRVTAPTGTDRRKGPWSRFAPGPVTRRDFRPLADDR